MHASRSEIRYGGAGLLPAAGEPAVIGDPASGRSSRLLAYRWPATDAAMHRRELVSMLAEPMKPFISLLAT